jgi:hypothetical protein
LVSFLTSAERKSSRSIAFLTLSYCAFVTGRGKLGVLQDFHDERRRLTPAAAVIARPVFCPMRKAAMPEPPACLRQVDAALRARQTTIALR